MKEMNPRIRAHIEAAEGGIALNANGILDALRNCDEIQSTTVNRRRWWEDRFTVVNLGGMLIGFMDAHTTGDNSPSDVGWEFDWSTVCEVEEKERTEVVKFYAKKADPVAA